MNRRHFLGVGLAVTTLPTIHSTFAGQHLFPQEIFYDIFNYLDNIESLNSMGKAYLQGLDTQSITRLRLKHNRSLALTADANHRLLVASIDADFAEGTIEVIDGWVVSRTEAELAAVAYMKW